MGGGTHYNNAIYRVGDEIIIMTNYVLVTIKEINQIYVALISSIHDELAFLVNPC